MILRVTVGLIVLSLLLFGAKPGGIEDAQLWLRADYGVSTSPVSKWEDYSANGWDAEQSDTTYQPSWLENVANFNPALYFTDHFLDVAYHQELNGADLTVFTVVLADGSSGDYRSPWTTRDDYPQRGHILYRLKSSNKYDYWNGKGDKWARLNTNITPTWNYEILTTRSNDANGLGTSIDKKVYILGLEKASIDSQDFAPNTVRSFRVGKGATEKTNGMYPWHGFIAETIVFNAVLDDTQRNRVESYLAIKYGITLDQSTGGLEYRNCAGEVIWDASANSGYGNDIAGVALDTGAECSDLDQRVSRSINSDAVVTMATSSDFASANPDNRPQLQSDHSFIIWSNSDGDTHFSTIGAPAHTKILGRKWKVQTSGSPGSLMIEVDVDDSDFDIDDFNGSLYFVKGADLSTATPQKMTQDSSNPNLWYIENIDFDNGDLFSFVEHFAYISGYVYEDINGDSQLDDKVAKSGVTVNLYAQSDTSTLYQTTTTDSNGYYLFDMLSPDERYWVVVDSKTLEAEAGFNSGYDQGDVWAEQTYGGEGAQCADGVGGTTTRSDAGSCFGGKEADRSDDASAYSTSEHLIVVDTDNEEFDNPNRDFAFSFNVVTAMKDGDDDSGADKTVQGSLRQFLQNADALNGANVMRFVPASPKNESSWWRIALLNDLSALQDDQTTIDGTAYSFNDGVSIDNSNAGSLSQSGYRVGIGTDGVENTGDEERLPVYEYKELEIDANDHKLFELNGDEITIEDLSIFDHHHYSDGAISLKSGSDGDILQRLFLGARADGSSVASSDDEIYIAIRSESGAHDALIKGNYVTQTISTGIFFQGWGVIEGNYLYDNGGENDVNDALSLENNSDSNRNVTVVRNYIDKAPAYGIESWRASGGFTIEHNTIMHTGEGGGDEQGGIRLYGSGSQVRYTLVQSVAGPGIVVTNYGSDMGQNIILHNAIYNNGSLSIDLAQNDTNGDGVTPNNGTLDSSLQNDDMDYPIVTLANWDGERLHIEGFIGNAPNDTDFADALLEVYIAHDNGNVDGEVSDLNNTTLPHGESKSYLFSCDADANGNFICDYDIDTVLTGTEITMSATFNSHGTSEFGPNMPILFLPEMNITKSSCVVSDPINGDTHPKRIPGATVRYAIEVTNRGIGDAGNVVVQDNVGSYLDTTTISHLGIDGSNGCNCLSPIAVGANGSEGSSDGQNPVKLDFDTVEANSTECGYFEVELQ